METAVIRKDELIGMLKKMDIQLEELDTSIAVKIARQHDQLFKEYESKIEFYRKQLDLLDRKITTIVQHKEQNQTSPIRLKYSY